MCTKNHNHMCTINEDYMIYGPWNIRCDRQKFSLFWAIWAKTHREILSFYTFPPLIIILWCLVLEIWSATDIFFSFWTVFCRFTPLLTQKIKIWKNEKTPEDIITLQMCTINDSHMGKAPQICTMSFPQRAIIFGF